MFLSFNQCDLHYVSAIPRRAKIHSKLKALLTKPEGETLANSQARKTNPNLNFWARILSSGVGVFHTKGWGPKSSVCPSKPGKSNFFGGISRDFAGISRQNPRKVWEKKVWVQFSFPKLIRVAKSFCWIQINIDFGIAGNLKTIFLPASWLEKLLEGLLGSSGGLVRRFRKGCDSAALVQLSKQPKCPKVLKEGAKGVFGPPGWDFQNSLLHGAKPLFRQFPPVRKRVWTVRETLWGLSAGRPQMTVSTLRKHGWALRWAKSRDPNRESLAI